MTNSILSFSKSILRKKTLILTTIILCLIFFLLTIIETYTYSHANHLKYNIFRKYEYRTLRVIKNDIDYSNLSSEFDEKTNTFHKEILSFEPYIEELSQIEHIINVMPNYGWNAFISSEEFNTNKFDGEFRIYPANNETIKLLGGNVTFPNDNGNYMVCVESFYPINLNDNPLIEKKDAINMKNYINKKIAFQYRSSSWNYKIFNTDIKLIGVIPNNPYSLSENNCYANNETLLEINNNMYSDDISASLNMSAEAGLMIEFDNYDNIDEVKKSLEEHNYYYEPYFEANYEMQFKREENLQIIGAITFVVFFIFIVIISIKNFNEDRRYLKLLSYLGYNKNQIRRIYIFSTNLTIIISILFSLLLSSILFLLYPIILNIYPYLFHNVKIIISVKYCLLLSLLIIISVILTTSIQVRKI